MKQRILTLSFAMVMAFMVSACGNGKNEQAGEQTTAKSTTEVKAISITKADFLAKVVNYEAVSKMLNLFSSQNPHSISPRFHSLFNPFHLKSPSILP